MKRTYRYLGIVLLFVICLCCIGCGNNSKYSISNEAASIGKKALDVTDQFLDGDIDYDTASGKLKNLGYQMDAISDDDAGPDDGMINVTINSIGATIYTYHLNDGLGKGSSDYYKKIKEARDRLADELGVK